MGKKEFDDLLFKKFQEEDLEYNPEHWDKLSQRLMDPEAKKKNKVLLFSLGIAAAVALVLASVLLIKFVNTDESNIHGVINNLVQQQSEQPWPAEGYPEQQNDATKSKGNKNAHPKNLSPTLSSPQPNLAFANSSSKVTITQEGENAIQKNHNIKTTDADIENREITNVVNALQGDYESPQNSFSESKPNSDPDYIKSFGIQQEPNHWASHKQEKQTSIGVSGGVNYGSLSTGYSFGLSAKQDLGKDFFVDGTIAFMYNNNTTNMGDYAGKTSGRPALGAINMSSPAFSPSQNLYYLQFNPSFGYQVLKEVAVSIGGDMQQMVSADNSIEKIKFTENGVETFPTLDFGLTGKAEFNVTPNIRTGVIFREGLSNLMNRNDIQYVNRRYFQVQFKYNIPVK